MDVEIYGSKNCSFCSDAIKAAKDYNLRYEYKNIDYKKYRDELELRVSLDDYTQCPFIFWNNRYVGTYPDFLSEIENTIGGYGDQPC